MNYYCKNLNLLVITYVKFNYLLNNIVLESYNFLMKIILYNINALLLLILLY